MRVLTFTTLFPNREMPGFGIFVAERLRHLLASGRLTSTVVAPVPWFPFQGQRFGSYSAYARVPIEETVSGCRVLHTRYPVIPKLGMSIAPALLALASYSATRRLAAEGGGFDLIDAHYFYPDGVAACLLGHWLDKPVVITARGSDLNLIPRYRLARRQIQWAIRRASALVTVSDALRGRLLELGAPETKISVLRNGVDLERFRPVDRAAARERLRVAGRTLLSVGNLIELKGHDIAIDALVTMADTSLIIAGSGPLETQLRDLASRRGVGDRVRFAGALDQTELRDYYSAADCLVLCSSREGMANVLLESLACGTPVVATSVGGNPEVISSPAAGVLMKDRSAPALVAALRSLFENYPAREATRAYGQRFSWSATVDGLLRVFDPITNSPSGR